MPQLMRLPLAAIALACLAWVIAPHVAAAEQAPARRVYATAPDATWTRSGLLRYEDFLAQLAGAEVVFLGENHDDPNTHVLQAELLAQLFELRKGAVCLSMEQFERDVQPVLDDYLAGRIDEAAFLAASRPWPNYDPDYRRMIEFCKANGVAVCAANIPRPLASRVAKQGFDAAWASYTPEERQWIAESTTAPDDLYLELFKMAMGLGGSAHGGGMEMPAEMLDNVYRAQCIKDDTMAESIARLRAADPAKQIVHTNGSFHSDYRMGTVMRVISRNAATSPQRVVVVAIRPVDSWSQATAHAEDMPDPANPDTIVTVADFVLYVPGPQFGQAIPAVPPTPAPPETAADADTAPAMPVPPPPGAPPAAPPQMPPAK